VSPTSFALSGHGWWPRSCVTSATSPSPRTRRKTRSSRRRHGGPPMGSLSGRVPGWSRPADARPSIRSAETRFEDRLPALAADAQRSSPTVSESAHVDLDGEQALDDQLALLVGCCHPALAPEAQVALTLRIVAGLSTPQIARAFLVSEETMTRRLTRAKSKVRAATNSLRSTEHGHAHRARRCRVRGDLVDLHRGPRQRNGHGAHPRRSLRRGDLARGTPEQARPHRSGSRRTPRAAVADRCPTPSRLDAMAARSCSPTRTGRCGTNR
jgi:DNA-directed RNA polymerase specialized sigma24 family protein